MCCHAMLNVPYLVMCIPVDTRTRAELNGERGAGEGDPRRLLFRTLHPLPNKKAENIQDWIQVRKLDSSAAIAKTVASPSGGVHDETVQILRVQNRTHYVRPLPATVLHFLCAGAGAGIV